jgi:hypothetical protein
MDAVFFRIETQFSNYLMIQVSRQRQFKYRKGESEGVMHKQKSPSFLMGLLIPAFVGTSLNLGNVLLSHTVTHAVPSALKGLTSVFGMGTGVSPSPWSPRNLKAGIMEEWNDGVMVKPEKNIFLYPIFQYSITPPFHKK